MRKKTHHNITLKNTQSQEFLTLTLLQILKFTLTQQARAALRKRRDFDEFICCIDKMKRERNIGKRKSKFVLCTILGNEKKKRLERANGQKYYG